MRLQSSHLWRLFLRGVQRRLGKDLKHKGGDHVLPVPLGALPAGSSCRGCSSGTRHAQAPPFTLSCGPALLDKIERGFSGFLTRWSYLLSRRSRHFGDGRSGAALARQQQLWCPQNRRRHPRTTWSSGGAAESPRCWVNFVGLIHHLCAAPPSPTTPQPSRNALQSTAGTLVSHTKLPEPQWGHARAPDSPKQKWTEYRSIKAIKFTHE